MRLAIDFENSARVWWDAGGLELWESIAEGFENHAVVLDESLARSWLGEAARISGWDLGPDYAPHPVRLLELDADDPEAR